MAWQISALGYSPSWNEREYLRGADDADGLMVSDSFGIPAVVTVNTGANQERREEVDVTGVC